MLARDTTAQIVSQSDSLRETKLKRIFTTGCCFGRVLITASRDNAWVNFLEVLSETTSSQAKYRAVYQAFQLCTLRH